MVFSTTYSYKSEKKIEVDIKLEEFMIKILNCLFNPAPFALYFFLFRES